MPLVILEGADGAGKSTLAAQLLKGTGQPTLLVKRSGPPGSIETLQFQVKWISDQAESGLNIIADRHPLISETIYAPVVRKVAPPPWTLADVAEVMRGQDLLLIYCRTNLNDQVDSARVENQMEGVYANYWALVDRYDEWMRYLFSHKVRVYYYDYQIDPEAIHAIATVKNFWEKPR